eukprot:1144466-Pelagomonas_calceolata.AAC.2
MQSIDTDGLLLTLTVHPRWSSPRAMLHAISLTQPRSEVGQMPGRKTPLLGARAAGACLGRACHSMHGRAA